MESALSSNFFTLILDALIDHIQEEVPECMLLVDDVVLVDELRDGMSAKLKRWREVLESKGFKESRMKKKIY